MPILIEQKIEKTVELGNKLHYSDINDLNYDFIIKYDYINLDLWYKAYIFKGMYLGTGTRIGFNLTPGALYYSSNGEDLFGPDIRIQQQIRDVLKGRSNFCLGDTFLRKYVKDYTSRNSEIGY